MEDINNWQAKFESCQYSDKLINKLLLLNKQAKNPVDIQEVKKAIYYAKKYHADQKRKSGEPYYTHPLEVAYLFAEHVGIQKKQYYSTDLIITAILHDTIEDSDLTKNMIAEIFNQSIASKVEDLTRVKFDKKITAGESLELLYPQNKKDILYVKVFDRLHNMRTIACVAETKKNKIVNETVEYFISLCYVLDLHDVSKELIMLSYQAKLPRKSVVFGANDALLVKPVSFLSSTLIK